MDDVDVDVDDEDDPFQSDFFRKSRHTYSGRHATILYQESPVLKKRTREEGGTPGRGLGMMGDAMTSPDLDMKNFDWDSVHGMMGDSKEGASPVRKKTRI